MQTVTFETAKLAKKKGFEEEHVTFNAYALKDLFQKEKDSYKEGDLLCLILEEESFIGYYKDQPYALAPFQCQLQKWLRDKHSLHIIIIPTLHCYWTFKLIDVQCNPNNIIERPPYKDVNETDYQTYEKALEKGLYEALTLI